VQPLYLIKNNARGSGWRKIKTCNPACFAARFLQVSQGMNERKKGRRGRGRGNSSLQAFQRHLYQSGTRDRIVKSIYKVAGRPGGIFIFLFV
jgi:hypothetical protein